jgi:hypothetical protein
MIGSSEASPVYPTVEATTAALLVFFWFNGAGGDWGSYTER